MSSKQSSKRCSSTRLTKIEGGSKSKERCSSTRSGSKSKERCSSTRGGSKSKERCSSTRSGSKSKERCSNTRSGSKSKERCSSTRLTKIEDEIASLAEKIRGIEFKYKIVRDTDDKVVEQNIKNYLSINDIGSIVYSGIKNGIKTIVIAVSFTFIIKVIKMAINLYTYAYIFTHPYECFSVVSSILSMARIACNVPITAYNLLYSS
jgi:hypothetical protein